MKKIIFTAFITLLISVASHAQVRVGPFLAYGNGLGLWGIGVHTELILNDKVSISPVYTQYFPESLGSNPRRTMWELNGNVNYYVIRGEMGYLYGLAGINYTKIRTKISTSLTDEVVNNGNLGINVGLGTMVRIQNNILPFAEAKYTVGGFSQYTLNFGVKFQIGESTLQDDY